MAREWRKRQTFPNPFANPAMDLASYIRYLVEEKKATLEYKARNGLNAFDIAYFKDTKDPDRDDEQKFPIIR